MKLTETIRKRRLTSFFFGALAVVGLDGRNRHRNRVQKRPVNLARSAGGD